MNNEYRMLVNLTIQSRQEVRECVKQRIFSLTGEEARVVVYLPIRHSNLEVYAMAIINYPESIPSGHIKQAVDPFVFTPAA